MFWSTHYGHLMSLLMVDADGITEAFGTKQRRAVEVEGDASAAQASSVSAAFGANPDVEIVSFDQQALKVGQKV